MKVGKYDDYGEMLLVECEQGKEISGNRTVDELYADGYKDVCEIERPDDTSVLSWQEFETCFVQVWSQEEFMEHPKGEGNEGQEP